LPIQQIQEIIRYTAPRSIASADPSVRGVLSLRGRLIPVYDLAARLSATTEITVDSQIIIIDTGSETVGVIVDGVDEVLTIDDSQVEDAPGADSTVIEAIAKVDDRLVVLLNPTSVFDSFVGEAA